MQTIQIICVGKLNASYFKDAAAEYAKRLSAFCKLEIVELAEEVISEKQAGTTLIEKALEKEGTAILQAVNKGSAMVALCIEGTQLSSEQLATYFEQTALEGTSTISFIIGSSHGLSDKVKNACTKKMSMSKMTFPHQLARVMLLEQIYRGFSISKGIKYHK